MKKVLKALLSVVAGLLVILSGLFPGSSTGFAATNKDQLTSVDVNAMTFNLRHKNNNDSSPHTWNERIPTIKKLINMENPDVIGAQEVLYTQLKDLKNILPHYNWIGGNRGEYSAIFYKEKDYSVLEYDSLWLSDTPEVIGSKTWGNHIPRMVIWAKFLDKKTKKPFYFVNTHFDHRSANAREKSSELILKVTKEFDPKLPVILTGDFNAGPDSAPHQILTSDREFDDLWETAETRINDDLGTFNGFEDPTGEGPDKRIDWILGKGNLTAKKIKIVNYQKNGQFPSDHFPVVADISLTYSK
ncbi:endonuclease/exonuclease/phosphatase family protein [Lederbergia wuyishanensis]|uniref:Endonuclease/exonuclease/phosphatase family metal-dependent hydrolase n=1 Tax=Lederbergia wuyishanensis TaxID=1347903 RepID=A0ABU0D2M6_9BACI|nr:endonuclease/exonuclease/phosphatase family protein [Lederbergia wuyishanensis]MCJ8007188.1 endonuclease/exonuclease/phosphatase family protein [Lederbergia wuyishanensis]MDQ0342667.1 endonuclease/exonuclease/phosphatase family metal-dependent hydrolase [Lederbergia wuyishanensis]